MEIPYAGRATVTDTFDHLEIVIPAKRHKFALLFIGFWLCGWLFGEVTAITTFLPRSNGGPQLFMVIWLVIWTVAGISTIRGFLWMLLGRETIKIGQGMLNISRKYSLFTRPQVYDLKECRNFRAGDGGDIFEWDAFAQRRRTKINNFSDQGTIHFDYGMKTVKFGGALDEVEANHLIQKLKDKKVLTANNFAPIA